MGWGILAGLSLTILVAWLNEEAILLKLIEIASDRRTPVGPHRAI